MSSRIEYIDRLKGLAILAVVMGHIIYFVFHLSDKIHKTTTSDITQETANSYSRHQQSNYLFC